MKAETTMRSLLTLAVFTLLAACMSVAPSSGHGGSARDGSSNGLRALPSSPTPDDTTDEDVTVYSSLPEDCDVVGEFQASAAVFTDGNTLPDVILSSLKHQAALLGANGVVITRVTVSGATLRVSDDAGNTTVSRITGGDDFTCATATAIVVR
jgi:hypothetical protein